MTNNVFGTIFLVGVFVLLAGCEPREQIDADEQEIALDQVPEESLAAARSSVKGIEIIEAEIEREDDEIVYELEGILDGVEYDIEVSADGELLEIESEAPEE